VVHPYESVPRPFDVVEKSGLKYTVEVKGKWVSRSGRPTLFHGQRGVLSFADRHITCAAATTRVESGVRPLCRVSKEMDTLDGDRIPLLGIQARGEWAKLSQAAGHTHGNISNPSAAF